MAISVMGILLFAKISPLYNTRVALFFFTRKLHCDRSLHIWVLDPICVQNFRPIALTVFEIQGLKPEQQQQQQQEEAEEEELEKWTFCHISHVSGPILTKL